MFNPTVIGPLTQRIRMNAEQSNRFASIYIRHSNNILLLLTSVNNLFTRRYLLSDRVKMGATELALCVMDLDGHRGNVLTLLLCL